MSHSEYTGLEIAVVGMAGRFPGANNVREYWENLEKGIESITFFSEEDLISEGVSPSLIANPKYVKANGTLADIDLFDAEFFGILPKDATILDPQHRLFLECAWEALENAGYSPDSAPMLTGIYAGTGMNTYLINLLTNPQFKGGMDRFDIGVGGDKDFITTRTSYKLNLRGPSIVVQSSCSTSLVAVQLACQGLLSGACDMALAGGVGIIVQQRRGYLYQEGSTLSPDGHCRAFDAEARGMVGGNGLGLVVLKRLEDALEDGDHICALIKGAASNNDGSFKMGYTAPSIEGQAEVIRSAQLMAEIEPDSISYVECHGTGTELGDPIEIEALTKAFEAGTERKKFCAVGSVKTNIGHLDTASGIAGLIKTILALQHKTIPASLHYKTPNPRIDFENSPFFVNAATKPWTAEANPRRAGVSSFGIGGTNAHVILEEAPPIETAESRKPYHLLVLSARTQTALESMRANLSAYISDRPELSLPDMAYTLQCGRRAFPFRYTQVCRNTAEALEGLAKNKPGEPKTKASSPPPVFFLFPGQGSQYPGMVADLYTSEPVFRKETDRCANILAGLRPERDYLADILSSKDSDEEAALRLRQTDTAQTTLFVVAYALAKWWIAQGVHPAGMLGHSIGEYVAACLAGVFTLEEGLELVVLRGEMMQSMPEGAMVGVSLDASAARNLLNHDLALAAVNGKQQCVISGPHHAIDKLIEELEAQAITHQRLHTSHAFHSPMMASLLPRFQQAVSKIDLKPPQKPYFSNVTGTRITPEQATDPEYWAEHLVKTVHFESSLFEVLQQPAAVFLEIGPGRTLTSLVNQHPDKRENHITCASLPHPKETVSEAARLLEGLGTIWQAGIPVDWAAQYRDEERHRAPLPTYPFERTRFWVDSPKARTNEESPTGENQETHRDQNPASLPEPQIMESPTNQSPVETLIYDQINLMSQQLAVLGGEFSMEGEHPFDSKGGKSHDR